MTLILTPSLVKRSVSEFSFILILFCSPLVWSGWAQPLPMTVDFITDKASSVLMILSLWTSAIVLCLSKDKFLKLNVLLLLWSLLLFFSTTSLVFFFLLFEASLIPTLCLILGWGYQPERLEATFYFIFYTITFSLPLLTSLIWLVTTSGSKYFYYSSMQTLGSNLAFFMLLVFMIKLPLFMGHLWLPKAHVEAPVMGSMLLAGVLLKTGGYGIVRVFVYMSKNLVSMGFMALGSVGMVCVCLVCLSCVDIKQLIAYSSVSHMNFMVVGLMNNSLTSYSGSIIMMVSHGLCSSLMFMMSDVTYKRSHSRSLLINKGLLMITPVISMIWAFASMLNMGIPPSAGSLSELLIISASKPFNSYYDFMFMLYLFLSAFYSMYLYMSVNHGGSKATLSSAQVKEVLLSTSHLMPLLGLTLMAKCLLL